MYTGKLYLIPTYIGDELSEKSFPEFNKQIIDSIEHFIVEEERTCRRFIKKLCPEKNINNIQFFLLNEHTNPLNINEILNPCLKGSDMGLMSEAGTPCIADPGHEVVLLAHNLGIEVIPLVGPSSILLALMASGLNGQNFAFVGYLPIGKHERIKAIRNLEQRSKIENQTQIFIEAPYRNLQIFEDILSTCRETTLVCVAYDIQFSSQFIRTQAINKWKEQFPNFQKHPAIFMIQAI